MRHEHHDDRTIEPPDVLERHLTGETTPGEDHRMATWRAEAPDTAWAVDEFVAGAAGYARNVVPPNPQIILANVRAARAAASEPRPSCDRRISSPRIAPRASRVFAGSAVRSFVVFGIVSLAIVAGLITLNRHSHGRALTSFAPHEYHTARGEQVKVQLPDGSTAILGPESRLQYAADFGHQHRTVALTGEALFTVAHDGKPPFLVRTGAVTTRVLGTTFAVRRYLDDRETQIVVAEGKVEVARAGPRAQEVAVLSTGDYSRVPVSGAFTLQHNTDIASALAWTTGRLDFTDAPLADVVRDVGRAYAIDLRVATPALGQQRVTVSIDHMSRDGVIRLLTSILGVHTATQGNTLYLTE